MKRLATLKLWTKLWVKLWVKLWTWPVTASLLGVGFTACLQTRTDVEEAENKKVIHEQVVHLQKSTADQSSHFQEVNEDLRQMSGRLEVLENRQSQLQVEKDKKIQNLDQQLAETNKKVNLLTEEIGKLEGQITSIGTALEANRAAQTQAKAKPQQSAFEAGDEAFQSKDWANAILKFSEYRDANPKGKKYPEATFKIGMSFESLGKKKEAKAFFEEILENYPKSNFSSKAKDKLKKLK